VIGTLYTAGYLAPMAERRIALLMRDARTLIVDIRLETRSRRPEWRGSALKAKWGERYWPLSALGNENYKTAGPIKLAMPEIGIPIVVEGLQKGCNIILLCACQDESQCHRTLVAKLVQDALAESGAKL